MRSCVTHFNPRTPCGVRRTSSMLKRTQRRFQSTHPVRGATTFEQAFGKVEENFNPRTPCGVRLMPDMSQPGAVKFQSTHPVRGATFKRAVHLIIQRFQSTHPVRGATIWNLCGLAWTEEFQSTHPVRGATIPELAIRPMATISIHAPRAGCDLAPGAIVDLNEGISIHAPRAGCDGGKTRADGNADISIHAPRAGCDTRIRTAHTRSFDFNPRTPCGVRRQI